MRKAVVMFAKAPVPGRVKTRLAASIGDDAAAELHAAFLSDLAGMLERVDADLFLAYSGDPAHEAFDPVRDAGFELFPQASGDLGDRLVSAARDIFARGYGGLVIIGSDSPTLSESHVNDAFKALKEGANVVFGPSFDGGYYLIGLDAPHAAAFDEIPWSSEDTLAVSWRRVQESGLLSHLMGFWYDVDNLADLKILEFHLRDVLCHNGAEAAPATLRKLKAISALRISPET